MTESEIRQRQKELKARLETIKINLTSLATPVSPSASDKLMVERFSTNNDALELSQIKKELDQVTTALLNHVNQEAMIDFKNVQRQLITCYKEFSQTPLTTAQATLFVSPFSEERQENQSQTKPK